MRKAINFQQVSLRSPACKGHRKRLLVKTKAYQWLRGPTNELIKTFSKISETSWKLATVLNFKYIKNLLPHI